MKFATFTKHVVIAYDCNRFVSHVKTFIIIISQMAFFHSNDHKYVVH
jgi:hypothetical protein